MQHVLIKAELDLKGEVLLLRAPPPPSLPPMDRFFLGGWEDLVLTDTHSHFCLLPPLPPALWDTLQVPEDRGTIHQAQCTLKIPAPGT